MALFDDKRFLLSHINHSFITGDDTGICEVVMLDEEVFENQHQRCLKLEGDKPEENLDPEAYDLDYESELFESTQGQSYDIASDLDYICHRRRSNTAQRLDRLKKDKFNQSRTKTIVWRCNSPTGSQSEDSPTSIEESDKKCNSPPEKSGLTRLLEKFPSLPKNPFDVFAQFDGGMSETLPVKKIMIFVAIKQSNVSKDASKHDPLPRPNNTNTGPLEVVVVSTARVRDLIGLICWQYTNEGREPKLNQDVDRYCLRIAEDNGEIDPDFTSLNPKEALSKFNFPSLALTEKNEERVQIYTDQPNDNIYSHRLPTIAQNVRVSSASGRFAALARILFKDAKLELNQ